MSDLGQGLVCCQVIKGDSPGDQRKVWMIDGGIGQDAQGFHRCALLEAGFFVGLVFAKRRQVKQGFGLGALEKCLGECFAYPLDCSGAVDGVRRGHADLITIALDRCAGFK